jgi:long-chain acyl-CoA synthetase
VRTGDLARVDEEGFLYIVDRAKDIVIRGGENIYCIEVENCLFEHRDVSDVAVVGFPHRTLGEVPVAVVQSRGAAGGEDLRAHCASKLAGFKVPAAVLVQSEPLPRNAAGKVLKREIAQNAAVAALMQGRAG